MITSLEELMSINTIDGKRYAEMLTGGAAVLSEHITELNSLNVFPVADGDTGTNMFSTVEGGLVAASGEISESIGDVSKQFARAALLSARGNSGVILSQIFAGINEYLENCRTIGTKELADAYKNGIKTSYASVQNPTEGTILTVFRESAEYAIANMTESSTVEDFFRLHVEEARRSLARTPELLPALAEAEVVDSGGAGYLFIAEGMYGALTGQLQPAASIGNAPKPASVNIDSFTRDSVLEFGYCTEFLLRLTTAKVDPDSFELDTILSDLSSLSGESVVAYKQDDIIKVHVHTFTPGLVLDRMQRYGEFLTLKIENMSVGHSESIKTKPKAGKDLATVTVSTGDGLSALFTDMGADYIINGGQTANPSIEEFIKAFDACSAKNILVLPNNKNILLAAEQAAAVYKDAIVHVIPTKNLMQGYSALSVINPSMNDIDSLLASAKSAAEAVLDGEITRAVRDVKIEGREILEGDYMAISGGKIVATAKTPEDAVMELLSVSDVDFSELITLFVGREVTAERRVALTDRIAESYPDLEITVYEGGQEVYDYLVAIE